MSEGSQLSHTEKLVAEAFARALESDTLPGRDDDIFGLGGDSLTAVRVALALERTFGVEVPPELLEEAPSVSLLAAWLDKTRAHDRHVRSEADS